MLSGARTQMLDGKYSFEEMFRFSRECGVEAFEYCCEDFTFHYRPETTEDYTIDHVNHLVDQYGIRIGSVGNHLSFVASDINYEAIKKMIPKTKRLGTDVFIISSNPPAGSVNYMGYKIQNKAGLTIFKARLRELLNIAEYHGIKLALEPEPPGFIPRSIDMLELMDEMKSDALCVNFDIGHAFLTDTDMLETIRLFGRKIVHAHIENLIRGEHLHRLLDDGDIDLRTALEEMKKAGFEGPVAIDLYVYEYDAVLKSQIDILKELMK
ncbi:sugar phosphate isomerase/epimerase [Lachnospiraceae bacterium 54-53]